MATNSTPYTLQDARACAAILGLPRNLDEFIQRSLNAARRKERHWLGLFYECHHLVIFHRPTGGWVEAAPLIPKSCPCSHRGKWWRTGNWWEDQHPWEGRELHGIYTGPEPVERG